MSHRSSSETSGVLSRCLVLITPGRSRCLLLRRALRVVVPWRLRASVELHFTDRWLYILTQTVLMNMGIDFSSSVDDITLCRPWSTQAASMHDGPWLYLTAQMSIIDAKHILAVFFLISEPLWFCLSKALFIEFETWWFFGHRWCQWEFIFPEQPLILWNSAFSICLMDMGVWEMNYTRDYTLHITQHAHERPFL